MATETLIPAAEYVRMSTDEQPNSIALQQETIRRYAVSHGYQVFATYANAGRSGIEIKYRTELRQLILDVLKGEAVFRAILVYDVSRWGRFQDTDEKAAAQHLSVQQPDVHDSGLHCGLLNGKSWEDTIRERILSIALTEPRLGVLSEIACGC